MTAMMTTIMMTTRVSKRGQVFWTLKNPGRPPALTW
jgi:hypothetical protein